LSEFAQTEQPQEESIWDNLSALDHRYRGDLKPLRGYLSERALIRYMAMVLLAMVRVLAQRGICNQAVAQEVEEAIPKLDPNRVAKIEKKKKHDVRSVVEALRELVSEAARPYIHFAMTSFDVKSTAEVARIRNALVDVVIPRIMQLLELLTRMAWREAARPQMGRSHGQHGEPITLGFTFASYSRRLAGRIELLQFVLARLRGKISGAMGAHNSFTLFVDDPLALEREVLADGAIQLEPDPLSTQIVAPEELADVFWALQTIVGICANVADDMRNLARTEIGEVYEEFLAEQDGSSTMPHKRNPWNFENVKSTWKKTVGRLVTVILDLISEHQRDLTNSASSRDLVELVANVYLAVDRLIKTLSSAKFNYERMNDNIGMTGDACMAEPLYLCLAAAGHPNAHEAVKLLTLQAETEHTTLAAVAFASEDLRPWFDHMKPEQLEKLRSLFADPLSYDGIAEEKTQQLCLRLAQQFNFSLEEAV
jgi:adenylosuccinate lyase